MTIALESSQWLIFQGQFSSITNQFSVLTRRPLLDAHRLPRLISPRSLNGCGNAYSSEFKIHSRRGKHAERLLDAGEVQASGPEANDVRVHVVLILVMENIEDLAGQRPLPRCMRK